MREQHIASHEEWRGEEKESDGKEGREKNGTACKGHTAQFISVKETIWLEFLLLSHSELLNSLFLHVGAFCMRAHVFFSLCLCDAGGYLDVWGCACVCLCVSDFLAACSPDAPVCFCVATY